MPRNKTMKKNLIAFLFAAFLGLLSVVPEGGGGPGGGGGATSGGGYSGNPNSLWFENESATSWVNQNVDEVTVDDAISWVDRKGGQIVELCAHVLKPVCIVCFIICILLVVAGAVGNKKVLVGGLIGLFICGLCYAFATSPVEILNAFSSFMHS